MKARFNGSIPELSPFAADFYLRAVVERPQSVLGRGTHSRSQQESSVPGVRSAWQVYNLWLKSHLSVIRHPAELQPSPLISGPSWKKT